MSCVEFKVNGELCKVTSSTPRDTSLNAYIRYALALPGTKAMCRQGGCGACIVTVRARRYPSDEEETFSVNSCLVLVFSCHGWDITTIEGLGDRHTGYDEIQKRFAAFNATQCGYCTPGWEMSLNSLLDKHLTMKELEVSFGSNTCRCTGFRPILDAIKSFAVDADAELTHKVRDIEDMNKDNCEGVKNCKQKGTCGRKCSTNSDGSDWDVSACNGIGALKSQEMIAIDFGKKKFYKTFDEEEIFQVWKIYGVDSYMLVDGNTAKGLVENYMYPKILIDISEVKTLKSYSYDQNLVLGANISLEDSISIFRKYAKSKHNEFGYLAQFADHLEEVAHIPVRNIGSIAGNLMTKHQMPMYPSDIFLLFSAVDAMVSVRLLNGSITTLTMKDFLKYDMNGVLMTSILLPPLSDEYIFKSYKIAPRKQNALAIVNAAFLIKIKRDVVDQIVITYGNISEHFIYAEDTEHFVTGKDIFNNSNLQLAIKSLCEEVNPVDCPPQACPEVRKKLAVGLFYKFILSIAPKKNVSSYLLSGGCELVRPLSCGKQTYETDKSLYPINKPVQKLEGIIQSSGEAEYVNDVPPYPREVFGAFVLSTVYSGEVDHVDIEGTLKIKGVVAVYTVDDIPGVNSFTCPNIPLETEDEVILAKKIQYHGQPVAIVVAESEELVAHVARNVKVKYRNVSSDLPILTIDQGKKIAKNIFTGPSIEPSTRGTNVTKIVRGVYEIEAQYHYYMEPITCVVVPVDNGLEVFDSTQWMDLTQIAIARCLNIKESQVVVRVRRLGGGFGGKLSRNVQASTACAIAAYKLNRPCRFILPIETNLTTAGRRLPCQCTYEVGVDDNGKIQYLNADIVQDDGCTHNEGILDYTIQAFPNCYNTESWSVKTSSVLTNLPSNTFARAPGTNEGISCIEHIMQHISYVMNKDPTDVRLINMRTDDNDLPLLIKELEKDSDYEDRCKAIEQFNHANRWMKKGINIGVMLFPVIYYGNYSAMVTIYRGDATVTVTTGGIEMGQGVNTKSAQVCAYELGIPLSSVSIVPSYSFVAANNVFSGSSIVSESVCYAIIKACEILKKRLEPIKAQLTDPTWYEIIQKAGEDQIDLVAEYMMNDKDPELEGYSAFAVTILETQLDCLTGKHEIVRADILEDVGLSTNPAIDIGQVEGAFIQGLGYYLTEKFIYDKHNGRLLTNRSLNYLVPLALDIPADFRVKLRKNSKNPKGVLGSKAVGEMGICSAHNINHVLRKCIMESRVDSGCDQGHWIYIDHPFTTDSILKALAVKYEEMVLTDK